MDLRGKRIEEGYTNLVTVEGDSVASSGKLQNGQGTDLGNVAVGGLSFNSGDSELQLPAGTTAERPASPSAGYARFNTDKGKVEIFTGASWLSIALEGAVQLEAATATVTGQDAVATISSFIGAFGTPASAFSVRQLGETDVCMRVRRSNDNAEQNIGFTSDGDLDETALTTFVGANDGFVTAWYDQSVDNSTLPAEHGSGATASYSLRKVNSSYTGDAIRVRRASDNTEQDIGFDANGELDTSALDTFVYGATALPADQGSGATASYSLRKVASAYTGNAIRVRRSSDNAEQDIGFVDGELDTSTLETFCSGTNGFVTTWYDQSGSNNATQATAGSQPQIVSSGITIKENGKPALDFDGTDDELSTGDVADFSFTQAYVSVVHNIQESLWLFGISPSGTSNNEFLARNDDIFHHSSSSNFTLLADESGGFFHTVWGAEWGVTPNELKLIRNGAEFTGIDNTTGSPTDYTSVNRSLIIASRYDESGYGAGTFQEMIIYSSESIPERQDIEHNQAVFYDIAIDGKEAFVTTWYDQSGSNNATQSTAGSQPKIYDGTTIKENGKPALDFDGSDDTLDISGVATAFASSPLPMSLFTMYKHTASSTNGQVFSIRDASDSDLLVLHRVTSSNANSTVIGNLRDDTQSGSVQIQSGSNVGNVQFQSSFIGTDGDTELFVNGSSIGSEPDTFASFAGADSASIGSNATGGDYVLGTIQEVVFYLADQSSNRESIELNQASYYDIGVSIGATQSTAGSQPKIVSSGTVIKENSVPALEFDGTADTLDIAPSIPLTTDNSLFFVTTSPSNSQSYIISNISGAGSSPAIIANYVGTSMELYNNISSQEDRYDFISSITNGTQVLLSYIIDNQTTGTTYADGTQGETFTPVTNMNGTEYNRMGSGSNPLANLSDVKMQELVVYNSDKSADRTDIESDIATYYNITI